MNLNNMANLENSLMDAIEKWIYNNTENENWENLNVFMGNNTAYYMTKAAMNVLAGVVDIQEFVRENKG